MSDRILIVDDEENLAALFKRVLEKQGYQVTSASNGLEALDRLNEKTFDLVVSDLMMPALDGLGLLERAKALDPHLEFIMLTGVGTIDSAVRAMKLGAFDYLQKPVLRDEILISVRRALDHTRLRREAERQKREAARKFAFGGLLGASRKMRDLFQLLGRVAESNATVLLQGESGTGKELIARALHSESPRRGGPFVAVDCGAIPESLIESELFGHAKGAFTGAVRAKKGLFEEADGGTLFLDEIGNLGASVQAKLLRVLQENEVRRVGSNESTKIDVRIIAASNRFLRDAVSKHEFREDLFYRLAVVPVWIPPLRERKEDIPLLAEHFIARFAGRSGAKKRLSPEAQEWMLNHAWPGNVRELENTLERAVILSDDEMIGPAHLASDNHGSLKSAAPAAHLKERSAGATAAAEREAIESALRESNGNKSMAARLLGVSRGTLYNKMRELDVKEP